MSSEFVEFFQFTSWKKFSSYYLLVSTILEQKLELNMPDGETLEAGIVELEGLTRYVTQCLLGTRADERVDTLSFEAAQWAHTRENDDHRMLLQSLQSAFEELHNAILSSTDEQLLEHSRPMWQPSGMSSPAEAILKLAFVSSYREGQLSVLLKDPP